jgi:hypothetical protein
MMKKLVSGVSASELFLALVQEDPSMDARKIGDILMNEFPGISPAAVIAIQRWLNSKRGYEFTDQQLDELILHYLKSAGYV